MNTTALNTTLNTSLNTLLDSNVNGPDKQVSEGGNEFNVLNIKQKITELSTALLEAHPTMPMLLREIHTQIRNDPQLISIISEEEIGTIVNGLKKQTGTELITTTVKQSKSISDKKKLAQLTVDDL